MPDNNEYYDSTGKKRCSGDSFYDSTGKMRNEGDAYYDNTGKMIYPDNPKYFENRKTLYNEDENNVHTTGIGDIKYDYQDNTQEIDNSWTDDGKRKETPAVIHIFKVILFIAAFLICTIHYKMNFILALFIGGITAYLWPLALALIIIGIYGALN